MLEPLLGMKGTFKNGVENVLKAFELDALIDEKVDKLSIYASMKHYQNTKDTNAFSLYSKIDEKSSEISAKTSFIRPELLALGLFYKYYYYY
jgi:oligoendopeptidase F